MNGVSRLGFILLQGTHVDHVLPMSILRTHFENDLLIETLYLAQVIMKILCCAEVARDFKAS